MPAEALVVPTILPTGAVHFAEVGQDATAQDVLNALVTVDEVKQDVLGSLEENYGWALQKVRNEHSGRPWEEDELEALGDGQWYESPQTWKCD